MASDRQRLRPWLEDMINSGNVPGLRWCNKEKKEFRVAWKHAGKPDFIVEKDAMLFKLWAEHTGKYRQGESADPSTWKTRFRCALHKMPDVEEVKVPHSLDEKEPYRVFRFKDKGEGSTNRTSSSPRSSDDLRNGRRVMHRQKPADQAYDQGSVLLTSPSSRDFVPLNNSYPDMSIGRQHLSPYHETTSDSSIEEDIDIDSITPTLPAPYMLNGMETMITDDQTCGTPFSQYLYPHSSGYLRYLTDGLDANIKRDLLNAVMSANAHVPTGSVYGEPTFGHNVFQQIKILQGFAAPEEYSMGLNGGSTRLTDLDNGLIEPSNMELDGNIGRMETVPYREESSAPSFAKTLKPVHESWDYAMYIRAFYDNTEVFSTETTLTENERVIRIFHGSPVGPGQVKMDVYSKVFGPPGARQVELPEGRERSKETNQVLDNLKRGLVLEMNEEHDIYVLRLCLSKVFYCNGREAAKKLSREERVKVFDYKGKFLPILKESRNGNCACPSYDITFFLGRANGSLVSIVVTHVLAKMSLHQASTAGETFLSEPNQNDQLATRLEQDCMY